MPHSNISVFVPNIGCPNMCSFCNQHIISGSEAAPTPSDVRRICTQALDEVSDRSNCEIAFFGGSFTAIPRDYMVSLLDAANEFIGEGMFGGIRISTRPDCIDNEILTLLGHYRVTVIELGAQSMSDEVLAANDRGHSSADTIRSSELIKRRGFSLGLQMMVGLYKATPESDTETAKQIAAIKPDFVRIYPTVVLSGTKLDRLMRSGDYLPMTLDVGIALCADLLLLFEAAEIPVIRLGLHASDDVEGNMTGGLYHPAFRELCENRIFLDIFTKAVRDIPPCEMTIHCAPSAVSKAAGQKRSNLLQLGRMGYRVKIIPDSRLSGRETEILFSDFV